MVIKKLLIKNFGKIHDRVLELSPGINVLYGENESGKTTVHTFLKSMFYGMHRQRGRAARTDVYSTYEPWENPSVYGGTLWFENGGKTFRLSRNFHKMNPSQELYCEDDGELLDLAKGDLDAVLGGISEAVYENTVSVAQLKSVTGQDLVRELQNYMASYQGTGDSSVDLGRAMQMLKMTRKGYQVQAERQRREAGREQDKLAANMDYLRQEIGDLEEKKARMSRQSRELNTSSGGDGIAFMEERIQRIQTKRKILVACMFLTLAAAVLGVISLGGIFPDMWYPRIICAVLGIAFFVCEILYERRMSGEVQRRKKLKARLQTKLEKLQWDQDSIARSRLEKETAYENIKAEYQETEEQKYRPLEEELEIEALNLAMETIETLSGNIHSQVGEDLRSRTSRILSEITGGKYREVLMDGDLHMMVNTGERTVALENLSRGTMEQIYFALRMAAGELLCGEECFPVILDDVFGMYDEERLSAVLHWLDKADRQIIISTCHRREMEILEREGLRYQKVIL